MGNREGARRGARLTQTGGGKRGAHTCICASEHLGWTPVFQQNPAKCPTSNTLTMATHAGAAAACDYDVSVLTSGKDRLHECNDGQLAQRGRTCG